MFSQVEKQQRRAKTRLDLSAESALVGHRSALAQASQDSLVTPTVLRYLQRRNLIVDVSEHDFGP